MGWVRVSDDFYDHPKFADITPLSWALWIAGLAYANRNLTDGYIPRSVAQRLCDFGGLEYTVATIGDLAAISEDDCAPLAVDDVVRVGLWHASGHDCEDCPDPGSRRFIIHDYLAYQPSAETVTARAAERSEAGKRGAAKRWADRRDGNSHSNSHSNSYGKTMANGIAKACPQPQPQESSNELSATAFETWWKHYPRKVGKGQARKAYQTALTKTDERQLLAAADQLADHHKRAGTETRFIPHPATWLNGERWGDDLEPPSQANTVTDGDGTTWDLGEWA